MIYAIEAVGSRFVKFGLSRGPGGRLETLQTGCPFELVVVAVADWPNREELRIHAHLAAVHHRGEWFTDGQEVSEVIEVMKGGKIDAWWDLLARKMPRRLRHHS